MTKQCFVISPIGEPDTETRKRSDQILKHIITPALAVCGYNAIRADQISEAGLITSQVIQHIISDPLVIADLTDRNPNVYYELALRHTLKKPVVQIIQQGELLPFDVAGMRTIQIDHHDLDSAAEAITDIIAQIKTIESKSPEQIESPISVSMDLQTLKQSDNPEQRSIADIAASVSEIKSTLDILTSKISSIDSRVPPSVLRYLQHHPHFTSKVPLTHTGEYGWTFHSGIDYCEDMDSGEGKSAKERLIERILESGSTQETKANKILKKK